MNMLPQCMQSAITVIILAKKKYNKKEVQVFSTPST